MDVPRTLLAGGTVVSLDTDIGTLPADVLIEDGRIAAVAPDLQAGTIDAEVLDVTGMIVAPGTIDTHRHTWQTQLRGLCGDWTLTDYFNGIRLLASPNYTPDDVRIGNLAGALEALEAGVTTILDFSHCMNTPDHADAAIEGLVASGIRAVHCHGFFESSPLASRFGDHAARVQDFARVAGGRSWNDRVRLGVALTETGLVPWRDTRAEIRAARDASALVAAHTGCVWGSRVTTGVRELAAEGLLGADQVHVHCNTLDPDEFALLAEAGAAVSCSPETELNMGMGRLAIDACLQHGIPPTLSCDIVSLNSGDLFTQLRLAIAYQRSVDNDVAHRAGAMPERLAVRAADALRWAAPNGADALGLGDVVGSITPGKEADVIVVGGPGLAAGPVIEPEATLVFQGSAATVRHVFVAGEFVKRDGELVGVDVARLRQDVDASAAAILDRMQAESPTLPPAPAFGPEVIEALADANFGER